MSSTIERSNGFLPLEPLRHADATAVGVWDMGDGNALTRPLELPSHGVRDQLVLARLHRQPLAIVHLDRPPDSEAEDLLAAAVWENARDQVLAHIRSCGCMPPPADAQELSLLLSSGDGSCPGRSPARPHGTAAVIVCTTGQQPDALARSLRSLTQLQCADLEIIVVDNRPETSATRELVANLISPVPVRYVAEPRPGLAIARNTGVAAATDATFVAFTDDDALADPLWLAWLLAPFAEPAVQAVTGLVMPLSLASAAEKRFEQYAGFGKGVERQVYDLGEHAARERFLYPYWGGMFGSGNSMAFRREMLLRIGGFDAALGAGTPTAGGEDLAAFTDVILAGGRVVYEPRSLCWHEHRSDEQALRNQVRNYGIGLTAVLWRYLWRDWRFSAAVVRSLPVIVRLARSRSADREQDRLPGDLARIEQRGRLLGPWRYTLSRRRNSARADSPSIDADAARQGAGGRHREADGTGATHQLPGERRPEADQAGAQTRT